MINFYEADKKIPVKQRKAVKNWIAEVIAGYGAACNEIGFVFGSDDFLLEMNKQHLQHDYYTDIITFDSSEEAGALSGECYLSVDRIKDNAKELGVNFTDELHRVMIHGVLHLLGFGDKTAQEEREMRLRENEALQMRKFHVEQTQVRNI
jgi:probable rRNA maturation factor